MKNAAATPHDRFPRRKIIDISVIVCTRNRSASLNQTLSAYSQIRTDAEWELIIVNNGSADKTDEVLDYWASSGKLPLTTVAEPRKGLARARNAGLRSSNGNLVVFSDDDCYPSPDFMNAWVSVFRDQNLDYAGGRIELFDPDDLPITIQTRTTPMEFRPGQFIHPGTIHGASMAFRRSALMRLGLFDERLGAGTMLSSGEDTEYIQRASDYGMRGGYRPQPLVWHHHGRKTKDRDALLRGYMIGNGGYYACVFSRRPVSATKNLFQLIRGYGSVLLWAKRCYWKLLNPIGRKAPFYLVVGIFLFGIATLSGTLKKGSSG